MLIAANGPKFGEVDWLAILELWMSNSAHGRYDRAWRLDHTPVANELQTDFDASIKSSKPSIKHAIKPIKRVIKHDPIGYYFEPMHSTF